MALVVVTVLMAIAAGALAVLGAIVASPRFRAIIIAVGILSVVLITAQAILQHRDQRQRAEDAQRQRADDARAAAGARRESEQRLDRQIEGLKVLLTESLASRAPVLPVPDAKKLGPALRYPYEWGYPAKTLRERFWMRVDRPLRHQIPAESTRLDLGLYNDNSVPVQGVLVELELPEGVTVTNPGDWAVLSPNQHYAFGVTGVDGNGGWAIPLQLNVGFKGPKRYTAMYRIRAKGIPERTIPITIDITP